MPKWTRLQIKELKAWMEGTGTTIEELAKQTGETTKRIKDRLSMSKYNSIPQTLLDSFYKVTSLECLKPGLVPEGDEDARVTNEGLIYVMSDLENRLAHARQMLQEGPKDSTGHPPAYLGRIRDKFYELVELLQDLKPASEKDIERIKKLIPPQDAGYFVSFMSSLYAKSSFQQYLNLTAYTPIGGKGRRKR